MTDRKRIWLQNITAADVVRIGRTLLPQHVYRKSYLPSLGYDVRRVTIGPPQPTDAHDAAALLRRGVVGVYGEKGG